MFKIEKSKPEHLVNMSVRQEFKLDQNEIPRLTYQVMTNRCYTVLDKDNVPLAIFGDNQINPKVVQLWAVISEDIKRYPIAFHKLVLRSLSEYLINSLEHRLQMTVREDFPAAIKWAKALGFHCEGRLKQYGVDGSDYLLFARVK